MAETVRKLLSVQMGFDETFSINRALATYLIATPTGEVKRTVELAEDALATVEADTILAQTDFLINLTLS